MDEIINNRLGDPSYSDLFPFAKRGMKVSSFISQATEIPRTESLAKLTEEEQETYLNLKKKVTEINPVALEYSKLFESRTVKGQIVISIDPVDYLLMSVNKSGWNSCYRLTNSHFESRCFGQYASGTFSYMCDPSTMIAYRHNGNEVEYKIGSSKIEAYSKNWRQIIYLDTVGWGFACSRQYPFTDDTLSKAVRELLEETLSGYLNVPNVWKFKALQSQKSLKQKILQTSFTYSRLAFNDIFNNGYGFFVSNPALSKIKEMRCVVDSNPVCPICGNDTIAYAHLPMCTNCKGKGGF